MSDTERPQSHEIPIKLSPNSGADARGRARSVDSGRTILIGILGGVASAVGYAVYQKLPDEQRDRLHDQARSLIASRLNEFRASFNI